MCARVVRRQRRRNVTCVYVCMCVSKLRGKNRLIASDNKLHLSNVYESYVSIGMGVSSVYTIHIFIYYVHIYTNTCTGCIRQLSSYWSAMATSSTTAASDTHITHCTAHIASGIVQPSQHHKTVSILEWVQ